MKRLEEIRHRIPQTALRIECLILSVLMIILLLFTPVVCYTYSGTVYSLTGMNFLFGKTISGGTVAVGANVLVWMQLILSVLIAVFSVLAVKLGRKIAAAVTAVLSLLTAGFSIVFSMQAETILSAAGAKRVGLLWGHYTVIITAMVLLFRALYILYTQGVLPRTYDVIFLAIASVVSLAAPYATYTYKKVSHPFTGFDMMTHKVINSDGDVTAISVVPYILIACAVAVIVISLIRTQKRRLVAGLLILCSCVEIVGTVILSRSATGMLADAVGETGSLFSLIAVVCGALILARALYILYEEKVLSALDFMTIPGLIYLLINNYLPMIGILLAFKDIDYTGGIWASPWVGLKNFKYLFQTNTAYIIIRNTLLYNVVFIALGIFTGMVVGICLAAVTKKIVQTFYQTAILLPQLISMIVVAYIVYAFLSNDAGFINKTVLGGTSTINFYGTPIIWPFLLTFVNNWKQIGYNAVIFLSSIVGIDRGLYEAAMVDGCGPWKQVIHITIPQLKPTIITLSLLQLGKVFYSDFGLFYQVPMDNGALYNVTNTIDTYVYRSLMVLNNVSNSAAASTFQAVCGFLLVFTVNMIVRKIDRENALF